MSATSTMYHLARGSSLIMDYTSRCSYLFAFIEVNAMKEKRSLLSIAFFVDATTYFGSSMVYWMMNELDEMLTLSMLISSVRFAF
jgi:hypothetical protein